MRKLLLTKAAVAVALCLAGCSNKSVQESVHETQTAVEMDSVMGVLTDNRDGKTYKTLITPDGKKWMAENLNYQTDSSWCYENADSNCVKYGRLYDWNTAVAVCPAGWHLPSEDEWDDLVDTTMSDYAAMGGWFKDGVDFLPLPGGGRQPNGDFDDNNNCLWWTATEAEDDSGRANIRGKNYSFYFVYGGDYDKRIGFSVRCVDDKRHAPAPVALKLMLDAATGGTVSADPSKESYRAWERVKISAVPKRGYTFVKWIGSNIADTGSAVTFITMPWNMEITAKFKRSDIVYGSLTDARDGKTYKTVKMPDGRTWTAENLNHETKDSSWCYENSADSCAKYGRLYSWNAAKKACPAGWRLPSYAEWEKIIKKIGGDIVIYDKLSDDMVDEYGFSIMNGGDRSIIGDSVYFLVAGGNASLWVDTKTKYGGVYSYCECHECIGGSGLCYADNDDMGNAFSVRCIAGK